MKQGFVVEVPADVFEAMVKRDEYRNVFKPFIDRYGGGGKNVQIFFSHKAPKDDVLSFVSREMNEYAAKHNMSAKREEWKTGGL